MTNINIRFLSLSLLPSWPTGIINCSHILWYNLSFACVYHFGTDKKIGLWRMCCYCHKGKAMFTLFFLLQAAVFGFPEHFNLLSSWTRETWPCPLITPSGFVVVNIRWGLCKRAIQSTFRTKGIFFFLFFFFRPENSKKHNRTQNVDKVFLLC